MPFGCQYFSFNIIEYIELERVMKLYKNANKKKSDILFHFNWFLYKSVIIINLFETKIV